MPFNYKPLFKLLIDRGMKREDLRKTVNASRTTFSKMSKGEYVALEVLDRICSALRAPIQNVIEHEPAASAEADEPEADREGKEQAHD
ncbi:helix-turn-helix transcriptional regulator [Pyramidobacter sp. YE332]|uniref:helix-turn-helix domain-containing protein n=1 Tax=Pyramidobacter sp. YE332 TaxID=3068894 RepID=UPI00294B8617|nr:helix-turn-helix transcriptional regulator [Pyramidobacter sp. YE332]WOL38868.1 helix-turn-helix transcriptional regulator [Pyramidobacter sp. YE332]